MFVGMEALTFYLNKKQFLAFKKLAKAFKIPFGTESNILDKQTIKAINKLKPEKATKDKKQK